MIISEDKILQIKKAFKCWFCKTKQIMVEENTIRYKKEIRTCELYNKCKMWWLITQESYIFKN